MNSISSKRYVGQSESYVNGDYTMFDISNSTSIFTGSKDDAVLMAGAYNHHYCLPNKQLKYFVMNFIAVYNSIVNNNGATYNLHTTELNPESGYMVAIPGFEQIYDIPADLNKFQDIVVAYTINRAMWDKITENPERTYLGFWINDGKLYVDLAENIPAKDSAITIGHERNQIAIYDCYERHDIRLRIC